MQFEMRLNYRLWLIENSYWLIFIKDVKFQN